MEGITNEVDAVNTSADRVRRNTSAEINMRLDAEMEERVQRYATRDREAISQRIAELDQEWDMERVLEMNASAIAFAGLSLAVATRSKKWLIVPGIVLPFLFQHAVQGWCPPVPLFRRLGVRTRKEIDREKYALKDLRGDFRNTAEARGEGGRNRAAEALAAVTG